MTLFRNEGGSKLSFITATQSNWFLIGPIAKVLGYLMNWIFMGISAIGPVSYTHLTLPTKA